MTGKARKLISWAGPLFQRVSDWPEYLHHSSGVQGGKGKGAGTQTCLNFISCCSHCILVSLSKLCSLVVTVTIAMLCCTVTEGTCALLQLAALVCRIMSAQVLPSPGTGRWMAVADLLDGHPAYGLGFQGQWVSVSSPKLPAGTACTKRPPATRMCSATRAPPERKDGIKAKYLQETRPVPASVSRAGSCTALRRSGRCCSKSL